MKNIHLFVTNGKQLNMFVPVQNETINTCILFVVRITDTISISWFTLYLTT